MDKKSCPGKVIREERCQWLKPCLGTAQHSCKTYLGLCVIEQIHLVSLSVSHLRSRDCQTEVHETMFNTRQTDAVRDGSVLRTKDEIQSWEKKGEKGTIMPTLINTK